jgi:hypothetical protein
MIEGIKASLRGLFNEIILRGHVFYKNGKDGTPIYIVCYKSALLFVSELRGFRNI